MHNLMLNLFKFLRSCIKFIKVVLLFSIVLLIMYWMQDLTNNPWNWFSTISPFYEHLLEIGKDISSESIMLFAAVFEFKYLIVLTFIGVTYLIAHIIYLGINFLEDLYHSGRKLYKNFEEQSLNTKLAIEQTYEQKKIQYYQIYIQIFIKQEKYKRFGINLEEQNKILLKHLLEKTGICPSKYQEGFLFKFSSFDKVDDILDIFSKLSQSKAPFDFLICLQIIKSNTSEDELDTLIGLKIMNKITTLANTVYRYSFNENQRYETSQIGLFQKGNNCFEVHEFKYKN